MFSDQLNC